MEPTGDHDQVLAPGQRRSRRSQVGTSRLAKLPLAVVGAALAVLMLGGIWWQVSSNPGFLYSCARSGQHALASSEGFVRGRFSDASGFQVQTYDCDSGGRAFLQFETTLGPESARKVLLADPRCQQVDLDEADGVLVECGSRRHPKDLFLQSWRGGVRAELYVDSR